MTREIVPLRLSCVPGLVKMGSLVVKRKVRSISARMTLFSLAPAFLSHPRLEQIDKDTGFLTRNMLCEPIKVRRFPC